MHSTGTHPAYLVYYHRSGQEPQRRRFVDVDLLAARRAAMTYAESLLYTIGNSDRTTQLAVYLVEPTGSTDDYTTIARALLRKMHVGPEIAGIDLIPVNRIADEQQYVTDTLAELYREAGYYKAGNHSVGLGTFTLGIETREVGDIDAASGELLCDALPYAYIAIGNFNSFVSNGRGYDLHFTDRTYYNRHDLESLNSQSVSEALTV